MRKILIVDDERLVRKTLGYSLIDHGYTCVEAEDGDEALRVFHSDPEIDIGFIDIQMPGKSGLDVISEFRKDPDREMEVIVMTGFGGVDSAVRALRLGAFDFLQKPFNLDHAISVLKKCESNIKERARQERIRHELEKSVEKRTERIQKLIRQVDMARTETVEALATAAEQRDEDVGSHNRRVAGYSTLLAKKLGWSETDAEMLGMWALLYDVGIIGIPDAIPLKKGPLSDEEFRLVQAHSSIGHQIITKSGGESMRSAAELALTHHERWDGSGYPQGLAGENIPEGGRIIGLCDVYDALRSRRPYRAPVSHENAVRIIIEGDSRTQPTHFDPRILEVFTNVASDFAEMFEKYSRWPNADQAKAIGG